MCKAPSNGNDDQYYLTGIVSYGIRTTRTILTKDGQAETIDLKCGKKDVPGVYTSVSSYTDWIYKTMHRIESNTNE